MTNTIIIIGSGSHQQLYQITSLFYMCVIGDKLISCVARQRQLIKCCFVFMSRMLYGGSRAFCFPDISDNLLNC